MGHLDSHCHFDAPEFDSDRALVAARALEAGVSELVLPGVGVEWFERSLVPAHGLRLHRAAGLHPFYDHPPDALERLARALSSGAFVAVGETGLDKRRRNGESSALCAAQLDLAQAHGLPVILHVVHAHEDLIALLKARPGLTGLVHAFAGPWELARRYLDLGFKLGIGGIATWPTARKLQGAVERCPADGYVLETDAPDLSPEWRRGERNEPREIGAIAQAVARLRGEEPEAVLASSDANGRAVFQLKVK